MCRETNAPLAVVEAIVGHSNPAMTRHYTHVSELAAGHAVAALPAVMGGLGAEVMGSNYKTPKQKILQVLDQTTAKTWMRDTQRIRELASAL